MIDYNKQILIVGAGPSSTQIDYSRVPKNVKVFRMNNFFFEDKYYVGKKVDYYLTAMGFCESQYFNLYHLKEKKEYLIGDIYIAKAINLEQDYPKAMDILPIIFQNKDFAEFIRFHEKYYQQWISGGILAIFLSYMLGYREIYLTGFDFYTDSNIYPWNIEEKKEFTKRNPRDDSNSKIISVIKQYHPEELQIKALNLAKNMPDLKLFSVSPQSTLTKYIPLAPELGTKFKIEEKPLGYINDWLPLPLIESIVKESILLPYNNKLILYLDYSRIRFLSHIFKGSKKRHYESKKLLYRQQIQLQKRVKELSRVKAHYCILCNNKTDQYSSVFYKFIEYRALGGKSHKTNFVHCPHCDFYSSTYRPTGEQMNALYDGYRGDEYQRQRQPFESYYTPEFNYSLGFSEEFIQNRNADITQLIKNKVDLNKIFSVLDYGGDKGQYIPEILNDKERYVYEISAVQPLDGIYAVSNLEELASRKFDFIMCCHVLEHLSDPLTLVNQLLTFLSPLGYLYIEVPYEDYFEEMIENCDPVPVHEHINFFRENSLKELLPSNTNILFLEKSERTNNFQLLVQIE